MNPLALAPVVLCSLQDPDFSTSETACGSHLSFRTKFD